jgi:hypothetical protein
MDFFEKWFGISPDNGNGSLEVLYVGVIAVILGIVAYRYWVYRRNRHQPAAKGD